MEESDNKEDGLVFVYLDKLQKAEKGYGNILADFYCDIHILPSAFKPKLIPEMNRLIRLFGKMPVFYAILDTGSSVDMKHDKPFGLLFYICKKRMQEKQTANNDLSVEINRIKDKLEKHRKLKIKEPND